MQKALQLLRLDKNGVNTSRKYYSYGKKDDSTNQQDRGSEL